MKTSIENWEKPKVKKLVLVATLAGIAGMIAIVIVAVVLNKLFNLRASTALLFIPWMVAVFLLIPSAYHQGVCDERQRGKPDSFSVNGDS